MYTFTLLLSVLGSVIGLLLTELFESIEKVHQTITDITDIQYLPGWFVAGPGFPAYP